MNKYQKLSIILAMLLAPITVLAGIFSIGGQLNRVLIVMAFLPASFLFALCRGAGDLRPWIKAMGWLHLSSLLFFCGGYLLFESVASVSYKAKSGTVTSIALAVVFFYLLRYSVEALLYDTVVSKNSNDRGGR